MGKPKGGKGTTYTRREPKLGSPSLLNGAITAEKMVEKINTYMESCDFSLAEKFADRALERFPDNEVVLETAAQCYTETGRIQKARICYEKAIDKSPLKGWRKYLGYGQLLEGKQALLQYTKGIEVMERQIAERTNPKKAEGDHNQSSMATDQPEVAASSSESGPSADTSDEPSFRDLSSAYLSVSELYTTDLCDEENAEDTCKYALEKAMLADPKNPETFQQLTNFYLIKDDKELARQYARGGLSIWYKMEEHTSGSPAEASEDAAADRELPPLAFQIETAKALIECEEFELAERLFNDFISQSPVDPELWYLRGFANFLRGATFYPMARSDLKKAIQFSTTPHGVCYDIINQCNEHLATIAAALPDGDHESDDEEEAKESNSVTAQRAEDDVEAGSEWETDEEDGGRQEKDDDVVME